MPSLTRRGLLAALAASAALPTVGFAAPATDTRTLVVLLRGGLDGLALVPRTERGFATARGHAAPEGTPLPLDDGFALHPALAPLKPLYDAGDLLVAHAVGLPYAARSHFDAQDLLESGLAQPMAADTGWLGRAVAAAGGPGPAWAFGGGLPLLLRGGDATSVDPTRRGRRPDARLDRLQALLQGDDRFGPALADALATRALVDRTVVRRSQRLPDQAASLAALMALPDGPRVGTLELTGWDTHTGQQRTLDRQLADLAEGLSAYAAATPPDVWRRTVVVVVTEFGRTVAGNGTGGTDHGVGGAALVLGGAVAGGVHADWPGLGTADLVEGRDLAITTDLRALLKGVLATQLGLDDATLARDVFPGSEAVAPLRV